MSRIKVAVTNNHEKESNKKKMKTIIVLEKLIANTLLLNINLVIVALLSIIKALSIVKMNLRLTTKM